MDAKYLIEHLGLGPHPEGGWFKETWRAAGAGRASGTAIYFLLEEHQSSHWHRVDAAEIWHHYAGASLILDIHDGSAAQTIQLGKDFAAGEVAQAIVPAHAWQRAKPVDGWVLVGCTVSPGFEFSGFELAAPDWAP
ncbi:MAG: cupin domain-containing protein [Pseudomonadota bacterium]